MPIDPLCVFLNPLPPRIPHPPFRIDPRIGTPDEIKVGDRVCLRGGGRGGNPLATRGTVTSVGAGHAEMIKIRTNLNETVLYFFWDVGREDYRTPAIQRIRKSSFGKRLKERAYDPDADGPMYKKLAAEVAEKNEFKPKTGGGRTRRRKRRRTRRHR